jgi:hypothetical protein
MVAMPSVPLPGVVPKSGVSMGVLPFFYMPLATRFALVGRAVQMDSLVAIHSGTE